MNVWWVFALGYMAAGALAYGLTVGALQATHGTPWARSVALGGDRAAGAVVAMFGPMGLIVSLVVSLRGLRWAL